MEVGRLFIGMPVYNGETFLRRALDSLLSQTFVDFDLIISDNASTDRTLEICLDYAKRDNRICYYRNEYNKGSVWNFNRVFNLARGQYFMWACHDDVRHPDYIRLCLEGFGASRNIILVGVSCESIDSQTDNIRFIDYGISTVSLSPRDRFVKYKTLLEKESHHIGGIFHGIYKREFLEKVMPMRNILTTDHLVLAELCFYGEFLTLKEILMGKKQDGASANLRKMARYQQINNPLFVRFPYLVREILLQWIIIKTDKLGLRDKAVLNVWSFSDYFQRALPGLVVLILPKWVRRALKRILREAIKRIRIGIYLLSGRKPWRMGYHEYKEELISNILKDEKKLSNWFGDGAKIPLNYGYRLDERIVEYPWLFSMLTKGKKVLLDAGSALNYRYLLDSPFLKERFIVIYTLAPEAAVMRNNISYKYGDLRDMSLKDETFDEIICISTLEHIGMDNTFLYTNDRRFKENYPEDYKKVIFEFRRLLKPGGRLFITVPYGRYENLGWLQQFDRSMVEQILNVFNGRHGKVSYYRYASNGWESSDAYSCSDCVYFDIHRQKEYSPDYVAAARAVACIELVK